MRDLAKATMTSGLWPQTVSSVWVLVASLMGHICPMTPGLLTPEDLVVESQPKNFCDYGRIPVFSRQLVAH